MSENLQKYTNALDGFDAVIQRVPADRWDADSPCEGWCARDVVAHAVGVMRAVGAMATTGEIVFPETPDCDGSPVELWNSALDGLLETLDDPEAVARTGNFWFGATVIDDVLAFTIWDPLAHAWDVAQATGVEHHGDDELYEASIAVISANADTLRAMGLMADPVEVPEDASAMTRFLGLTGRDPNR